MGAFSLIVVINLLNRSDMKFSSAKTWHRVLTGIAAGSAVVGTCGALAVGTVAAEGFEIHPPHFHWNHNGPIDQLDMKSVRRGYEVYKQVCSACHSMKYMYYRNLVNNTHTEEEAREEAAAITVVDADPDEQGNPVTRPGKLADRFPAAFPNEEAARYANNGAYPPDLSLIVNGRHGHEDYIFAVLTGYYDPPAGVAPHEDQYFNAYMPGNWISMAPPLYNEIIEYSDGTPATQSQLAKDVVTFLRWSAEPEFNDRKRMFIKAITLTALCGVAAYAFKQRKWAIIKSRKSFYHDPKSGKMFK